MPRQLSELRFDGERLLEILFSRENSTAEDFNSRGRTETSLTLKLFSESSFYSTNIPFSGRSSFSCERRRSRVLLSRGPPGPWTLAGLAD